MTGPNTPPSHMKESRVDSLMGTAIQSLNTSQIILDDEKIDFLCDSYKYDY